MTEKKKRTRLSPHGRRMQLLDCARTIIQERGLSLFTMAALAKEAGVSNPLIYKYFDTRLELLQELFKREHDRFYSDLKERFAKTDSFEEIVRIVVDGNFDEATGGSARTILASQPDVRTVLDNGSSTETRWLGRFLIKRTAEDFTLTPSQAEQLVVLGSGASRAAAEYYNEYGGNRKKLIDNTVQFILAGFESFARG